MLEFSESWPPAYLFYKCSLEKVGAFGDITYLRKFAPSGSRGLLAKIGVDTAENQLRVNPNRVRVPKTQFLMEKI